MDDETVSKFKMRVRQPQWAEKMPNFRGGAFLGVMVEEDREVKPITSVLVLTQLFSDLVISDEGKGTVSILLGLDIDEFTGESQGTGATGLEFKIPFLFFALVYAVASSILIWGSIVEINYYAYPWLFCEALSFATQVATFTIICINMAQGKKKDQIGRWVILVSISNLFLSIYFWIVVFCAQRTWSRQKREERENMSTTTLSSGNDTLQDEVYEQPIIAPLPEKRCDITFDPSSLSAHPDKRIDIHFVD